MRKALLAAVGLSACLAACQNYDFHHITATPVQIISNDVTFGADAGTAYIMIVQDTSGSMCETITGAGLGCATNSTQTKLSQVAQDMTTVLTGISTNNPFYIGLIAFPGAGGVGCNPPTAPVFPIAVSSTNIPKITNWYANATPLGGTPTAATLLLAGTDPGLATAASGASRYVILITDGYPNCDPNNPCGTDPSANTWSDGVGHGCVSAGLEGTATPPSQCQCGEGSCTDPTNAEAIDCCFAAQADPAIAGATIASDNCLDNVATDAAIAKLYSQGIKTFVVGVGTDFDGNYTVLNAMAAAGNPGATAYQANSPTALATALQNIIGSVTATCNFALDATPASAELIEVTLDGTNLTPNDGTSGFTYDPGPPPTVNLGTGPCSTVKNGNEHTVDVTALGAP